MRVKLFAASIWTLGLLFGMLAAILLLALYSSGSLNVAAVLGLTVILNVLMWLVSPKIMDWTLKFFYKATFYSQAELQAAYPNYAQFIAETAQQHKVPFPKVRIINDDNPTAYSFGSGKWNSRLVFTQGILTYLEEDEVKAVLAHELGHVVHRDFIVMSVANALIQLMYEIYYICARSSRGGDRKDGRLALIGWAAYIFYIIGTYLVLYLNRLREYYADEFSAETLKQGDALSRALIKVAYGIMAKEDTASGARLLESTKTMGIMSLQAAKSAGLAMKVTNMQPDKVAQVMLFDIVSPWAKLAELSSTHPLTGKRILRLQKMDTAAGRPAVYDIDTARRNSRLDKSRLWRGFLLGGFMYFLIWILVIVCLAAGVVINAANIHSAAVFPISFVIILALLMARLIYKYPAIKTPPAGDVYSLMTDLYASPVRGRPVQLNGAIVGRGTPGYMFSEDMMMQDNTGLLYLDYQGRIPLFSNLMFALKKIKKLIGQNVSATGWFFRSNTQFLRLKDINAGAGGNIKSYPRLWAGVGYVILALLLSLYFGIVAIADPSNVAPQTAANGYCYETSPPTGSTIKTVRNCEVDISYPGSAADDYKDSLSLVIKPFQATSSFQDMVASFKQQSDIGIVSDAPLTVDGLNAEKIVYYYYASPDVQSLEVIIDSSSRLKGDGLTGFTEVSSNYSPLASGPINQILNSLKIKNAKVTS